MVMATETTIHVVEIESKVFSNTSLQNGNQDEVVPTPALSEVGSSTKLVPDEMIPKRESWWQTASQVALPYTLGGAGTIGAGIVLSKVQRWPVFDDVSSLFILIPALIGLKGNLDMCLSSRLATQANLGNFDDMKKVRRMVIGNLALVQIQAIVAALVVSIFAVAVGAVIDKEIKISDTLLLAASSITTATSSCFILDLVLVAVILISRRLNLNPDNVATPLGASIGDIVSITLLSNISAAIHTIHDTKMWVSICIVCAYLLILPIWIFIAYKNEFTRPILKSGWTPVMCALFISGFGGLVLGSVVDVLEGFVIFQPIINGIGGNLVSVQASRVSTMLHQTAVLGEIPPYSRLCVGPWAAVFSGLPHASTARVLLGLDFVGQIIFAFVADAIHHSGHSSIGIEFVVTYVLTSLIQVILLLYLAHLIIHLMWKWKIDPDNCAIPYLTAIGDLTGSGFLAIAFLFLKSINMQYNTVY